MSRNVYKKIILKRDEWVKRLLDPANTLEINTLDLTQVPAEWKLSERKLDCHYLTLVISSVNHVESASFAKDIGPGGFLWLNPGEVHSMHPQVKLHPHQFYHLKFSLHSKGTALILDKALLFWPNAGDLRESFHALCDAFQQSGAYSEYLIRSKLAILVCEIFQKSEKPESKKRVLNKHQRQIINLLHEPLTPTLMAKKIKLNPDYFSRIFKNTYGCSPRSWLTRERLRKAAVLLSESNLSISEISSSVGYEDIYVFSKLFKKQYAYSPRHYRDNF